MAYAFITSSVTLGLEAPKKGNPGFRYLSK